MSEAVPISGAQAAEIIRDCGEIKADTAYKKDKPVSSSFCVQERRTHGFVARD